MLHQAKVCPSWLVHIKAAYFSVLNTGLGQNVPSGNYSSFLNKKQPFLLVLVEFSPAFHGSLGKVLNLLFWFRRWISEWPMKKNLLNSGMLSEKFDKQMVFGCKLLSQVKA